MLFESKAMQKKQVETTFAKYSGKQFVQADPEDPHRPHPKNFFEHSWH